MNPILRKAQSGKAFILQVGDKKYSLSVGHLRALRQGKIHFLYPKEISPAPKIQKLEEKRVVNGAGQNGISPQIQNLKQEVA